MPDLYFTFRITSFGLREALVEIEYHLLYKMLYLMPLLALDNNRPIMCVAFLGRLFPPLSRMPQNKFYLYRLSRERCMHV